LRHLSNPLEFILKRFNAYSNNDIIRVAEGLGGAVGLEGFLRERLDAEPEQVQLQSASGELTNRLTPRLVVRLLRELHLTLTDHALAPHDLLPVPGCDNAPVSRMFPALTHPPLGRSMAVKTGTLRFTDGGVAALAGFFANPERGLVLFCVAAPRAGSRIQSWRSTEQQWLLSLISELGGASPDDCGPEVSQPDALAMVGPFPDPDPGPEVHARRLPPVAGRPPRTGVN
jgi:D-alanyl-D-alanine carboxypeptidase